MNVIEKIKTHKKKLLITIGSSVFIIVVLAGATLGYAYTFGDKVYPGVSVGTVDLSGLTLEESNALIQSTTDDLYDTGLSVTINGTTETIPLRLISPDDPDLTQDLILVDTAEALEKAYNLGRSGNVFMRILEIGQAATAGVTIKVSTEIDTDAIEEIILDRFAQYYNPAVEPSYEIQLIEDEWTVEVIPGSPGRSFDLENALEEAEYAIANLEDATMRIPVVEQEPEVSDAEATWPIEEAIIALRYAPYTLEYEASRFERFSYTLDAETLAESIAPMKRSVALPRKVGGDNEEITIGLSGAFDNFIEQIVEDINVVAQNAKFEVQGKRVREFKPSQEGREMNVDVTRTSVLQKFESLDDSACPHPSVCEEYDEFHEDLAVVADVPIEIDVFTTDPSIETGEVNDLGITEVLGIGTSNFSGSPSNRIKNIRHGVNKLNGLLIAPDEEFSLIAALRPFTIEDGYLPELVIKGDEIKPEVAGGLCQIGSTTFRAAMNSGLEITQRRNHSLVVDYYNDQSNGNPGTDATIYDPAPDFRFRNNTENYILFTTSMNVSTGDLAFTFWGTADGRKGYYSAPVVHNWIGAGDTQYTYTTDLEPGVEKCQGAHPGANASFTYTVEQASGEIDQTVYESHYRSLPRICLVGATQEDIDARNQLEAENEDGAEDAIEDLTSEELADIILE